MWTPFQQHSRFLTFEKGFSEIRRGIETNKGLTTDAEVEFRRSMVRAKEELDSDSKIDSAVLVSEEGHAVRRDLQTRAGKIQMRLIIHAPFMHAGGGVALLAALLTQLSRGESEFTEALALIDRRFQHAALQSGQVKVLALIRPTLLSWILAERTLALEARPDDVVLCFGNLPPLFRVKGYVVTFIQNTYLAVTDRGISLPIRSRLQVYFQRLWLRITRKHASIFAVQTHSMRDRLVSHAGIDARRVVVTPFVPEISTGGHMNYNSQRWDLGYISLPWAHKNHLRLIEALVLLAQGGITPSLVVTVPETMDKNLFDLIERMKAQHNIRVTNLGKVPYEKIGEVYCSIRALIFPSLTESFALPLLEAKFHGVPIIAPELDYVRDVVIPTETFDPESARSIMRAIQRFLGQSEEPPSMPGSGEFLRTLSRLSKRSQDATAPTC